MTWLKQNRIEIITGTVLIFLLVYFNLPAKSNLKSSCPEVPKVGQSQEEIHTSFQKWFQNWQKVYGWDNKLKNATGEGHVFYDMAVALSQYYERNECTEAMKRCSKDNINQCIANIILP